MTEKRLGKIKIGVTAQKMLAIETTPIKILARF